MPTERQLAANRENAQKSTGPRTPEGKAACAQNASRHAKLADEVLLACEDRQQFIRHSRRYHREFQPVGHLEKSLVNDMVAASWRRGRLEILEARLIDHSYNTIPEPLLPQPAPDAGSPHPDHSPVAFRNALGYRELVDTSKVLPQLSRDAARHNRDFHKALSTLLRLRATQAKNASSPAPAVAAEDPYHQGNYDRQVIPPPADPPGTVREDLLGLFGSVSTPNTPTPTPPDQTESTTSDDFRCGAGWQPARMSPTSARALKARLSSQFGCSVPRPILAAAAFQAAVTGCRPQRSTCTLSTKRPRHPGQRRRSAAGIRRTSLTTSSSATPWPPQTAETASRAP